MSNSSQPQKTKLEGAKFRSHQGEHLLRSARITFPLFVILSLLAIGIFLFSVIDAANTLPAAAVAVIAGWAISSTIAMVPVIWPRLFEVRQARTLDCAAMAAACCQLSIPLATYLLCDECEASTRRCNEGDASTQIVAAQVPCSLLFLTESQLARPPKE